MSSRAARELRLSGLVLPFLILALWELNSRVTGNPFFPGVAAIIAATRDLIVSGPLLRDIVATLARCLAGYSISVGIGVPTGLLMGNYRVLYRVLQPTVEALRPLPSAATIPIALLFLGIGNEMKLAVVAFGSLWPVLVNTLAAVTDIDPLLEETARMFGVKRSGFGYLRKVVVPAASVGIMTGMRISLAIALILAITVEMIAGSNGVGFLILDSERSFRFPEMYGAVLTVGIVGYLLNLTFLRVANSLLRWYRGYRASIV